MKKINLILGFIFILSNLLYSVTITGIETNGCKIGRFEPTEIEDCELWLDADDINSMGFNGTKVSQWYDKSGNNNHLTQSTTDDQPSYLEDNINNKNVISFNRTNGEYLINNNFVSIVKNPHTIFFITRVTSNSSTEAIISWNYAAGAGVNDNIEVYLYSVGIFYIFNTAGPTQIISEDLRNTIYINTTVFKENNIMTYKNGVLKTNLNISLPTITPDRFSVGMERDINTPSDFYDGEIGEIIMYSRALKNQEKLQIENYLKYKWGIS